MVTWASVRRIAALVVMTLSVLALSACGSVDQSDSEAVGQAFLVAVLGDDVESASALAAHDVDAGYVSSLRKTWTGSTETCELTRLDSGLAVDARGVRVYAYDWLETSTMTDGSTFNQEGHGVELIERDGEWFVNEAW